MMIQPATSAITRGLLVVALVAMLCPLASIGQPVIVTGAADYEYGLQPGEDEITNAPYSGPSGIFNREKYNHTVWLALGFIFPGLAGEGIELEARASAGYSMMAVTGELRTSMTDNGGQTVNAVIEDGMYANATTLRLDLIARNTLFAEMKLELGAWFGYRINGSFSRQQSILEPLNAQFPSGGREMVVQSGSEFSGSPISIGAMMGLAYDIPVARMLTLRPALRLRSDLRAVWRQAFWRSMSLGGGLGVMFNGNPAPEFADRPPTDPPDNMDLDSPPGLKASLDLYSIGDSGEHLQTLPVQRRVTLNRQHLPFLPLLFFESGSEHIPERYRGLPAGGIEAFTPDSLAGRDLRWLHRQGLNLLGMRLRNEPSASITLVGTAAPGEPRHLGKMRAEEVRRYLRDIWGVEESRIAIKRRDGTQAQVVAEGGNPMITGPVVAEWSSEDFDASQISLSPAVEGGRGLRNWDVVIRQNDREVARYSSDGEGQEAMLDMGLILKEIGSGPAELVAELTAEDSSGNLAVARDRLPIVMERRAGDAATDGNRTRTVFVLLPPSSGIVPASGRSSGIPSVETIAASIHDGDRITITYSSLPEGTASSKGTTGRSLSHAQQVARRIEQLLNKRGLPHTAPELIAQPSQPHADSPETTLFADSITVIIEGRVRDGAYRE